jgi:hypothetical protein
MTPMSLNDTLAKLKQQEMERIQWEAERPGRLKQWQEAVANLLKEIRDHLAEYEAAGALSFSVSEVELSDDDFGKHSVATMSIIAPSATVVIAPTGQAIMGYSGCVDMVREGRQQNRVSILRTRRSSTDPTPVWAVRPLPQAGIQTGGIRVHFVAQQVSLVPLSKDVLEQHLEALLG